MADTSQVESSMAEVMDVYDGDTITVLMLSSGETERVRLLGIDTAELNNAQCTSEFNLALRQKHLLKVLVGEYVELEVVGRDKYNRLLATVYNDQQKNVNDVMLTKGEARYYSGGYRAGWCD